MPCPPLHRARARFAALVVLAIAAACTPPDVGVGPIRTRAPDARPRDGFMVITPPPDAEPEPDVPPLPPDDAEPPAPGEPLPPPWTSEDVGRVGIPGGALRAPGRYEVRGSGSDIWGPMDGFHFAHRPVSGDVEIVARLVRQEITHPDARAGVMLRESALPDARNVFMTVFPTEDDANGVRTGKGSRLQFRDKRTDTLTGYADLASLAPDLPDSWPVWLRIVRRGARFSGYLSNDGTSWVKDGEVELPLPAELLAGLAVSAHTNEETSAAWFEGVRLTALTDSSWRHAVIGSLGGFAGGGPDKLELEAIGAGLAGKADAASFVHRARQQIGDFAITARVSALAPHGTTPARTGLLLRSSLAPGARMLAFVVEHGGKGQRYYLLRRMFDNGSLVVVKDMLPAASAAAFHPVWLRLARTGNRFVASINLSPELRGAGGDFSVVFDQPGFIVASNVFLGLCASAGTEAATARATIEGIAIDDAPRAGVADGGVP